MIPAPAPAAENKSTSNNLSVVSFDSKACGLVKVDPLLFLGFWAA